LTWNADIARKLLLKFLKSPDEILITGRAYAEARRDFGLTKDGIISESIKALKGDIDLNLTEQDTGSTGWVIKPDINGIPAYFKFCIEDQNGEMTMTIVSAHKQVN